MLIAMDPNETVEITLTGYEPTPDAPKVICRQLTARDRMRMKRFVDQAYETEAAGDIEKTDDLLCQIFGIALVGWQNIRDRNNVDVPFAVTDGRVTALGEVLTYAEMWDVEKRIWMETSLSEMAKKKSVVQRIAAQAQSAKTAEAAAKIETPPASTAPPAKA